MKRPLRVLLVEDRDSDAEIVLRELRNGGFAPEWERVETEAGFLDSLQRDFDIILSDYSMPQFDGLRALALVKRRAPEIPFILVSGTMGEETAVAAMKQGATDYLLKDRLARLGPAVSRALEQTGLRRHKARAEEVSRESEERFRQLAENIQEVFWLTDPTKKAILYVSPAYETMWGRSRAAVYADPHSWLDAIHPEDKEAVSAPGRPDETGGGHVRRGIPHRPAGRVHSLDSRPRLSGAQRCRREVTASAAWRGTSPSESRRKTPLARARSACALSWNRPWTVSLPWTNRAGLLNSIQRPKEPLATTATEAMGQLLADLIIPPASRERHRDGLARYLSTGEARSSLESASN